MGYLMHKKTTIKLKELAKTILALEADTDFETLKKKSQEIYEELCVLNYLNNQPKTSEVSSEQSEKIVERPEYKTPMTSQEPVIFSIEEEIGTADSLEDIFIKKEEKEDVTTVSEEPSEHSNTTLKEKIEAAKLAVESTQEIDKSSLSSITKASLNDKLLKSGISVDLNDRIAFVKHLFEGRQEDFNRVLSQLNTFSNENDAKNFILNQVKPDYSWEGKETYEERLILLIERKFM
jgi:hypothetical protein